MLNMSQNKMGIELLESLRKYRPREGKDPLENFITEAVSWILKNHADFSKYFLDYLLTTPNMQLQGWDNKITTK